MSTSQAIGNPMPSKRQVDAEVGRRVHMLMWDRGLTQSAFGERVGIDQSALAKKLRGSRGWSLGEVVTVAQALNVSVAYLFGEDDGVGPAGIEPTTSTVKTWVPQTGHMAEVIDLASRRAA